jgi:2-polyprenyl-3-methyl-5-hydroxy-6-metoxy-1,4-benzoquinol methylase
MDGEAAQRKAAMPAQPKTFRPFPHDWHSTDYVSGWITHDVARDPERRPLLRQMLACAPFARDAELNVLDVGAGYGVVTEEVLGAFPQARITLQDYSQPMLDQAHQRLAEHSDRLRYVVCDLLDPSWPQEVGGSFDLVVSAIVLHNLPSRDNIFACYRSLHDLLGPEGWFLNYDRFLDGVDWHMGELHGAGFAQVECTWQQPPHAIVVAGRATA